jgi:hypothetical protein
MAGKPEEDQGAKIAEEDVEICAAALIEAHRKTHDAGALKTAFKMFTANVDKKYHVYDSMCTELRLLANYMQCLNLSV